MLIGPDINRHDQNDTSQNSGQLCCRRRFPRCSWCVSALSGFCGSWSNGTTHRLWIRHCQGCKGSSHQRWLLRCIDRRIESHIRWHHRCHCCRADRIAFIQGKRQSIIQSYLHKLCSAVIPQTIFGGKKHEQAEHEAGKGKDREAEREAKPDQDWL